MFFESIFPFILASSSPRRKELLETLGFEFSILPSDIDEDIGLPGDDFGAFAEKLARAKAEAVASGREDSVVIGADTIVVKDGRIFHKPKDAQKAIDTLSHFSGASHSVYTGVAVIHEGKTDSFAVETKVFFRKPDDELIKAYVATGDPMDKAGAYGIQTAGALLVDKIEGDYYNVVGLPVAELASRLRKLGLITLKAGEA